MGTQDILNEALNEWIHIGFICSNNKSACDDSKGVHVSVCVCVHNGDWQKGLVDPWVKVRMKNRDLVIKIPFWFKNILMLFR